MLEVLPPPAGGGARSRPRTEGDSPGEGRREEARTDVDQGDAEEGGEVNFKSYKSTKERAAFF